MCIKPAPPCISKLFKEDRFGLNAVIVNKRWGFISFLIFCRIRNGESEVEDESLAGCDTGMHCDRPI